LVPAGVAFGHYYRHDILNGRAEVTMSAIEIKTRNGGTVSLEESVTDAFSSTIQGEVVTPSHPTYDEVRAIWNAMIDRRPGLIVRCSGASDVVRSVEFARQHDLLVAVRGAGHNIAGNAVCDGGLMIDLSLMKSVSVDPTARTAVVEPGVTLGELDHATQAFGLATPVGINSTTGIAGLTLGGGFGWLSRKHGLTVDSLISANVVTANGELVVASEQSHPDLFWGIRGGGGNFGIVTSFEFRLHEIGPEVMSGLIVYSQTDALDVLNHYREFTAQAPDELSCWAVLRKAPPLPFLPEEVHGTDVLIIAVLYAGDMTEGESVLGPLKDFGNPVGMALTPHQFTDFQAAFDPLLTPGVRNYWKSHNFKELSDPAIEVILRYAGSLPSDQSEIFLAQMGGATSRVPADATAYVGRDANFVLNVHTRWEDEKNDDHCISWAREFFKASAPHASGGAYINFMTEEETDRIKAAYGDSYDRLAKLKASYDPDNFFRLNQNIQPAQ
jgi:FAD/FMN-containing dehydrogenase